MRQISKATLQRYPLYLKALKKIKEEGKDKIMSNELANYVDIKPTTIRRDFSLIGSLGKQGYGYDVEKLIEVFNAELGGNYNEKIILIGVGNFGKAILNYSNWQDIAGEITCAFDVDPSKFGKFKNIPVYPMDQLKEKMPEGCRLAIITVSSHVQEVVDELASLGVKGIVNATSEHFLAPQGMIVRNIDIVSMIQELVFATNALEII